LGPDGLSRSQAIYREFRKSVDKLSGKRDEVIGNLMNVCRVGSHWLVNVTEPRSNWIIQE